MDENDWYEELNCTKISTLVSIPCFYFILKILLAKITNTIQQKDLESLGRQKTKLLFSSMLRLINHLVFLALPQNHKTFGVIL
jgi:hypothetical protein